MTTIEAFRQAFIDEGIPENVIDDLLKKCPLKIPDEKKNHVLSEEEEPLAIATFRGMISGTLFTLEKIRSDENSRN